MSDRSGLALGGEKELREIRALAMEIYQHMANEHEQLSTQVKINACLKLAVVLTVNYAEDPDAARAGFVEAAGYLYDEVLAMRGTNGPGGIA